MQETQLYVEQVLIKTSIDYLYLNDLNSIIDCEMQIVFPLKIFIVLDNSKV